MSNETVINRPLDKEGSEIQTKTYYRDNSPKGWEYSGFWDGFLHYTRKSSKGYEEIQCYHSDILNGNINDMTEKGLTRV